MVQEWNFYTKGRSDGLHDGKQSAISVFDECSMPDSFDFAEYVGFIEKEVILKSVRQVGKTWASKNSADVIIKIETAKDVDCILQNLMLASGQKIVPELTPRL